MFIFFKKKIKSFKFKQPGLLTLIIIEPLFISLITFESIISLVYFVNGVDINNTSAFFLTFFYVFLFEKNLTFFRNYFFVSFTTLIFILKANSFCAINFPFPPYPTITAVFSFSSIGFLSNLYF